MPLAEIQKTIEDDLNVRVSKAFLTFDAEPLASASLGQVHRAALRDGRPVAVKVQRPGILDQVLPTSPCSTRSPPLSTSTRRRPALRVRADDRVPQGADGGARLHREASQLRTLNGNLAEFPRIVVPRRSTATSASAC